MKSFSSESKLTLEFLPKLIDAKSEFRLVDIGASGGIDDRWRQFGALLTVFAFDPLVSEVERLNRLESNPKVQYFDAWIVGASEDVAASDRSDALDSSGSQTYSSLFDTKSPSPPSSVYDSTSFQLTSAVRATNALQVDYIREHFNKGEELRWSENRFSLDSFCTSRGFEDIDFIKVDTDGFDFQVLTGAVETLRRRGVLGLQVECQFHGAATSTSNTFANIDNLLRASGFALFDLDIWKYTRAELPGDFFYDIPAQTRSGQVQWAEALYLIDPTTRPTFLEWALGSGHSGKVLKLAMLFDMFGLKDCAAALLIRLQAGAPDIGVDYEHALNMLVPENPYGLKDYKDYVAFFDRDPKTFFPSNWAKASQEALARSRNATPNVKRKTKKKKRWRLF